MPRIIPPGGGGGSDDVAGLWIDGGSKNYGANALGGATTTTSTAAAGVDVDAATLEVAGTYPASGKIRIVAQGICHSDASDMKYIMLRDSGGLVAGTKRGIGYVGSNGFGAWSEEWIVSGTAAAAFAIKLGWSTTSGTLYMAAGPDYGPWTIDAFNA